METRARVINTVHVVDLQGRLDAHQGKQVDQKLAEVMHSTNQTVVNMSKVHFIDSTGLKHHREKNGDLVLCELQQPVRIIFELTRLERVFQIYATENEAVQAFQ
jgi:anti-sigma B factor antagonist